MRSLVGKSILVSALLLLAYSLFLRFEGKEPITEGDNNRSRNIMQAERYVFDNTDAEIVMIGTSLAWRLPEEPMPPGFFNLSMVGKGPFLGLRVMAKAKTQPRLILIETNHLERQGGKKFLKRLFRSPFFDMKRSLPALREERRPSLRALTWLKTLPFPGRKNPPSGPARQERQNSELFEEVLARHVTNHARAPKLDKALRKLAGLIRPFRLAGSTVVFFEIPTHPLLCESVHLKTIRTEIMSQFEEEGILYVEAGDCSGYATTDGHHLDEPSAGLFVERFLDELGRRGFIDATPQDER